MIDTYSLNSILPVNTLNPLKRSRLNEGLELWLKCLPGLDGSNKWFDLSKNGINGTLTNMGAGSGWGRSPAPGGYGSLRFDGLDDYVDSNSATLMDNPDKMTISAWVKIVNNAGMVVGNIASKGPFNNTNTWNFQVYQNGGVSQGKIYIYLRGSTTAEVVAISNSALDSNWHRVTWVKTSNIFSGQAVYVDGVPWTLTNGSLSVISGSIGNSYNLTIGNSQNGYLYQGNLDSVKIYSRALSAAEVRAEYQDERAYCPDTLNRLGGSLSAAQSLLPFYSDYYQRRRAA